MESFKIELRDHNGDFMTRRTIQISDQPPIEILIVDGTDSEVANVLGGGDEFIKVVVTDYDDSIDGVYGDLTIKWPGQSSYSLPVEFNDGVALIPLSTMESIENGDLLITANITGANGASGTIPHTNVLSPPEILSIDLCQDGEEIDQLMFGQTADAVVRVRSSRQVGDVTAEARTIRLDSCRSITGCSGVWERPRGTRCSIPFQNTIRFILRPRRWLPRN